MKEFSRTLHIDVPPDRAFATVVDPEVQQGRFMKIEVVEETQEGVGTMLRYHYQVLGRRLGGGTYTYSEYVPGQRFKFRRKWTGDAVDGRPGVVDLDLRTG